MRTFKFSKLSQILLLAIFLLFLTTCKERDITNPFDPACPKEVFTPTNFKAEQSGTAVKLSWKQVNTNISGFVIKRSENDGASAEAAWLTKLDTCWNDINTAGGKKYGYLLNAYAGDNQSNILTVFLTPVFGATVATAAVSDISSNSAVLGGNVINEGGAAITDRGICYSTTLNPTTSDKKVEMGGGIGAFSITVTGLISGTTYYARAYATNSQGTTYGTQVTFMTSFLTVTHVSYTVPKESGNQVFPVFSNIDWQVICDQTWCTLNVNGGKGNGSITAIYDENTATGQRTAKLTFSGIGVASPVVNLTQSGTEPPVLTVTPDNQDVTNLAGTTIFNITSNISWTAQSDQTWCTVSNTSGTGNATLNISYEANTTNSQRIAAIAITKTELSHMTVTVTQKSALPIEGLVAYYPFNGNANDESGKENNGVVNGAVLSTDRKGNSNSAYAFSGSNNYIQAPNLISGNNFSVNVWISSSNATSRQDFISGGGYLSRNAAFLCYTQGGLVHVDYPWVPACIGITQVCNNNWYFVTLNVSNGITDLYVNGIKESSFNSACTINGNELNFGRSNSINWGYSFYYTGKIDDIRLYNRALTEDEIKQLFKE